MDKPITQSLQEISDKLGGELGTPEADDLLKDIRDHLKDSKELLGEIKIVLGEIKTGLEAP